MIYIITGPTHCGKSTFIQENKKSNDIIIDLLDFQDNSRSLDELMLAQYNFLADVESKIRQVPDRDIWIEGCWSNPYRIGQIINTVRAVNENIEITVYYILRDEEWYRENLDIFAAAIAAAQLSYYKLYNDTGAAVYKVGNKNTDIKEIKN